MENKSYEETGFVVPGTTVTFLYEGSNGKVEQRQCEIERIGRFGNGDLRFIQGMDTTKGEYRTFSTEKMKSKILEV